MYADFVLHRVCVWIRPPHPSRCSNSGAVPFLVPVQIRRTRKVEKASEGVGVERFVDRRLGRDNLRRFRQSLQVGSSVSRLPQQGF